MLSTAAPAIRRLLDAAESVGVGAGAGAGASAEERQRRTVTRPISDFVASVLGDFDMGRVTVQFTRLNELADALIVSTFNRHSRPRTKASDVLYAVLYEHKFVVHSFVYDTIRRVWDATTGACIVLKGHYRDVYSASYYK